MKRLFAILVAVVILAFPLTAYAEISNDDLNSVISDLDLNALEEKFNEESSGNSLFDNQNFYSVLEDFSQNGVTDLTVENALNTIAESLKEVFLKSLPIVLQIIVILVVMSVLKNLQGSFEKANVSKTAFFAGYVVICSLSANILIGSISAATQALESISGLVDTLTPILITLLTAMGGLASSALMSPAMAALTGSMYLLIKSFIFPAIIVCAVVYLTSGVSTTLKLNRFGALVESAVKWTLGILFTVYIGICALKGFSGAALDGLSIRTAKYTIDHSVPVIGGMFSDTVDTLVACSLIVKNAIGAIGMILIAGAIFMPLAVIMINMFLFKIASAVAEPFADEQSAQLLSKLGNVMTLLFVTLLVCGAMAFIAIALLLGASNVNMMMR